MDSKPDNVSPAPSDNTQDDCSATDRSRIKFKLRLMALAVLSVTLTLLAIAKWLSPDSRGYDTHTALGLPACSWPQRWGKPCPACGMTTAFANMADGKIVAAFQSQIFGALLAVACFFYSAVAIWQLIIARNWLAKFMPRKSWIWPAGILFLAAWAIKAVQMSNS